MSRDKMRVVALGGCGGMGQFAVRTALNFDFVQEIVIADRDGERARAFAEQSGPKASSAEVDIEDSDALARVLKGADVVLATVGPYYRFGVPILKVAIEAKCHYIDINDDWEPTLKMLELDEAARKAKITAIIGMGASPGLSNLLAVKAMSLLDTVEDLITGWGIEDWQGEASTPGEGGSFGAAFEHWLHQCSGQIRLFRDGQFADVSPLQDVKIDYPGIGLRTTYTVGHPEPVTLPLFRKEIRNSCNVMVLTKEVIALLRLLAGKIDSGRMTVPEAVDFVLRAADASGRGPEGRLSALTQIARGLRWLATEVRAGRVGVREGVPFLFRSAVASKPKPGALLPGLFAYATGVRNGKSTRVAVTLSAVPPGGMGGATGVPLALALAMFARGLIDRQGVFASESVIDPDAFFDELAPLCDPPLAGASDLLKITTSP